MTDLSLATFEEIQNEMNRRFPAWVILIRHLSEGPQGSRGVEQDRMVMGVRSQAMSEVIGLIHWAAFSVELHMKAGSHLTKGIQPLDGPGFTG